MMADVRENAPDRFGFPPLCILLALGIIFLLSSDVCAEGKDFHDMIKLSYWDKESGLGSFKDKDRNFYVVQLVPTSKIRVDKPIPGGNWSKLKKLGTEIYCFSKKDYYQMAFRTVGALKPRLVLAMGFAITPLPKEERRVNETLSVLGWHPAVVTDWHIPAYATVDGALFDLGLNVKELIMFGQKGEPGDIKKGQKIHLDGIIQGTRTITRSGKILTDEEIEKKEGSNLIEVPVIEVTRIVVLHRAFSKVYRYCFEESYMEGASEN